MRLLHGTSLSKYANQKPLTSTIWCSSPPRAPNASSFQIVTTEFAPPEIFFFPARQPPARGDRLRCHGGWNRVGTSTSDANARHGACAVGSVHLCIRYHRPVTSSSFSHQSRREFEHHRTGVRWTVLGVSSASDSRAANGRERCARRLRPAVGPGQEPG